jgi:beta-glucosidase
VLFGRGTVQGGSFALGEEGGIASPVTGNSAATGTGRLKIAGVDRRAQEDARLFVWDGSGTASASLLTTQPLDISREATGQLSLVFEYRVDSGPTAAVTLGMDKAALPITGVLRSAPAGQWQTMTVPLRCFASAGVDMGRVAVPFRLTTAGKLSLALSDIRIASAAVPQDQCGRP